MSRPPAFVLGVDGGNTKTIAAVARSDGTVVGVAQGGSSDIYGRESPDAAIAEICQLVQQALGTANITAQSLAAAAFSLAGADWPEDFELLESELRTRLGLSEPPLIVNDCMGALRSGAPRWEGVAVACGTFNAIGARNRDGRIFHLGFWPDQRGGFDLGLAALKAVYRAGFDLGPKTALTPRVLEIFDAKNPLTLMHKFTRRKDRLSIKEVGRLAPVLLDTADAGDAVSRAIVADAGKILGEQARSSACHVGLPLEGANIVLTGGVLQHPSRLLADAIMACLPGATAIRAKAPPIVGALLLAFDTIGVEVEAEKLTASLAALSPS